METMRATQEAQKRIEAEVGQSRRETHQLLSRVRLQYLDGVCESAVTFALDARQAIRSRTWFRAADRCSDARRYGLRLMSIPELLAEEVLALRPCADDLLAVVEFIERNRLHAADPPPTVPTKYTTTLDLFVGILEQIRGRFLRQVTEVTNTHAKD